jgi:elongation factor G
LPRGSGFTFTEEIKGGVVPRNYIPSVEEGVADALKHGPLGFPVVDITAKLVDGSYHTVDSSDMAFQLAGRLAIHEGLPQCQPVLLEPIYQVEIVCPSEATAKMNALMSGRRGQILGFDTREGWDGWDVVRVQMPESEIGDLIVEVRSATAGVGSFTFKFDHMAELVGRTADQIVAARKSAAA